MTDIPNGSDFTIQLTIEDENGNGVNIGNCDDIIVYLYQKREYVLAEYKLSDNQIVVIDAINGIVAIYAEGNVIEVQEGKLFCEAVIDIVDANYDKGYKRNILSDILIGKIVNSINES